MLKARVPFGPFLALGAIEYLFFGAALLDAWSMGVRGLF
jgi:prepilin signal peptidase PulO-like enzyme (type II secretory pathway)